jgi:hypothetical protein
MARIINIGPCSILCEHLLLCYHYLCSSLLTPCVMPSQLHYASSIFFGRDVLNDSYFHLLCNQTRPHATVEVEISEDMQHVHFDFNR